MRRLLALRGIPSIFSALFILLVICGQFSAPVRAAEDPPRIGGLSAVSLAEEKNLGRTWWRQNYRNFNPVSDYILQSYAEHLVALLAQTEQMAAYDLQVHILPSDSLNAFAAPGGIIGIYTGLWRYAEMEDEFASVVAHELAHLSQRHFVRMLQDARGSFPASLASVLAGIGLIIAGNPAAGALAIYGTAGYQQERFLAMSRRFEREADNLAYDYMARAGFSPEGALNMFYRMERLAGGISFPAYMSTHPLTSDRLHFARLRAAAAPRTSLARATDYPFIRLRAMSVTGRADVPANSAPALRDYAMALELSAKGSHKTAAKIMQNLAKERPGSHILFFSAAELRLRANEGGEVRRLLEERRKYLGDSAILHYFLAQACAQQQDWEAAIRSMLFVLKANEEDEAIWRHLADYYAKQKNNYAYFRADAIYRVLTGEGRQAQRSFKLAKQHAAGDTIRLADLEATRTKFGIPGGE